jgi:hypothetical protein
MNYFVDILGRSGLLKRDFDYHLLRASMVIIFAWFGYDKWGYFKNGVGNAAYEACGLKAEKSSFPAMRNSTVRMVLKLAYPRALRLAA